MLKPLQQFYCDTCGNVIENPNEGWFEWTGQTVAGKQISTNFRICHHKKECQILIKEPYLKDLPLQNLLGDKGIIRMLNFLDIGDTFVTDINYKGPQISDFRGYTEIFRRLTISYYEEARMYWQEADDDGENEGQNEVSLYLPDRLQRIAEKYSKL